MAAHTVDAGDGPVRIRLADTAHSSAAIKDVAATGPAAVWVTGRHGHACLFPTAFACGYGFNGNPVVRRWTGSS